LVANDFQVNFDSSSYESHSVIRFLISNRFVLFRTFFPSGTGNKGKSVIWKLQEKYISLIDFLLNSYPLKKTG